MRIRNMSWLYMWVTTVGLVIALTGGSSWGKQAPRGSVATVNGVVITQGDFDREMINYQRQLARRGKGISEDEFQEVKKRVLEILINRELLYQESQRMGFIIDDKGLNEQYKMLKERFPSEEEFKTTLLKMKISEKRLKSQLRKQLAIQKFIDKQFAQKIEVDEKEAKAFYDRHPELFKSPEQVRARHLLIKVPPGADEAKKKEARKRLEAIKARLEKGEDFSTLAKTYSEGPSKERGGDLGYFRRGQMVKPFEDVAFALSPGKVSGIVETKFGYHLIKVIDKRPESKIAFKEVRQKLEQYLKQQHVQKEVNKYVEGLRAKAKVERFLKNSSK